MNVILVQHNEQDQKKYCFAVPDHLISRIRRGVDVICDTGRGNMPGRVVSDVLTGEEADRAIVDRHATMPLKSIISVVDKIDISSIQVPIWMELSKPRKDKLAKRKQEIETIGCVKTKVSVDEEGILQDGYTAYLVCKNMGMSEIPVAVCV